MKGGTMEELERLKEKFRDFVKNSIEELGVFTDKFDFAFSEPICEFWEEITKNENLYKKLSEIDFVFNISLKELGRIPYKHSVHFFPHRETENMLAIYTRYKLENDLFVEDPKMTGYRLVEEGIEESLVWIRFWFEKRPYLPNGLVKKYELKGCSYSCNFHYPFEYLSCPCVDLEFSFKNLNALL
jgi:hypothetical protein